MTVNRSSRNTFFSVKHHSPISRIAIPLLVASLATGCDKLGLGKDSPTAPSGPPAPGSTIVYDAVGASDADGVGSSVVCPPFVDCPNGTGYPQVATRQLQALGYTVLTANLGIPTAVIGPDFQALGQQYNRVILSNFITGEMPLVRTNATLVTIFAGGNEINTITAALGGGAGASDQAGYIDAQVRAFGVDYATLLNGIRARAGSARIIVLNVPNLAGFPFLAQNSLPQRQAAQRAAVGMTKTVVNALVSQDVTVVDVMCDSRMYLPSNFSADGFHPNDAGYAFIAGEIARAVTSSAYPVPQNDCGFMAIVPNP
jgi:lysophospholipase L1-like esterase